MIGVDFDLWIFHPFAFPQDKMHTLPKKIILTSTQAVQIYNLKATAHCESKTNPKLPTASIAKLFGISPKTVRDIWKGRTWYRQTLALEHSRPDAAERLARRSGRPKGSKDKQQRTRRQVKEDSSASSKAKAPPPTDVSATGTECPGKFDQAVASETLCPAKYVAIIQSSSPANGAKEEIPHWLEATSLGSTDPFHDDWPHWK